MRSQLSLKCMIVLPNLFDILLFISSTNGCSVSHSLNTSRSISNLIGPNGILDSLSTATFMLSIENQIERDLGKQIDMTSIFLDDEILSKDWKLKEIETWINEKI